MIAHASYLINLASPDPSLRAKSLAALEDELVRADLLGLAGVVLHPGAYTTSTAHEGIKRIADGIDEVLARRSADGHNRNQANHAELLLEHTAGQGTVLGHRFEQLRAMVEDLDPSHVVGICLDTCHLVGAGYDIISEEGYAEVFREFDATIGLERLRAFHLNDSKKPLGSRLDRHENIGQGCLGIEPFRRIVTDARFAGLPMVLETPKSGTPAAGSPDADAMDVVNLTLLKELMMSDEAPRTPPLRT